MVIDSGEEHRAGGAADGGHVEIGELHARPGQIVQMRRGDLASVNAQVRIAQVVGDDQQDVRAPAGGACRAAAGRVRHEKGKQRGCRREDARHRVSPFGCGFRSLRPSGVNAAARGYVPFDSVRVASRSPHAT